MYFIFILRWIVTDGHFRGQTAGAEATHGGMGWVVFATGSRRNCANNATVLGVLIVFLGSPTEDGG